VAVLTLSYRGTAALFAEVHRSVLANPKRSLVHLIVPPSDAQLFREYQGEPCRVWTHRELLPAISRR
jgi:hypothetical protein